MIMYYSKTLEIFEFSLQNMKPKKLLCQSWNKQQAYSKKSNKSWHELLVKPLTSPRHASNGSAPVSRVMKSVDEDTQHHVFNFANIKKKKNWLFEDDVTFSGMRWPTDPCLCRTLLKELFWHHVLPHQKGSWKMQPNTYQRLLPRKTSTKRNINDSTRKHLDTHLAFAFA